MVSRVTLAGDFRVLEGGKEGKGGWWCGEKQLKLHRGGRWWRFLYRKREERGRVGSEARVRREQKPVGGRRWARRKMLEPICSPLSRLLLSFRPPPFVPSFFGQRRNLCYLLVTFIWSPRVLDLSRYSLSLFLSLLPSAFLLSPSPTPFSLLSPTNSPQPRTARNFLFRILDP